MEPGDQVIFKITGGDLAINRRHEQELSLPCVGLLALVHGYEEPALKRRYGKDCRAYRLLSQPDRPD